MAHFLKPLGANSAGFKQRSDGVLTSMTIGATGTTKVVVLWGGGKGGEILMLAATDSAGKRLATTRLLGREAGHAPDPDGDDRWFLRYELKTVGEGTGTLTAVDKTGMPFARIELLAGSRSAITKLEQTLKGGEISTSEKRNSVEPGSVLPFERGSIKKGTKLLVLPVESSVHELLFRMDKDGVTYWVGACVPEGTSDFSRAYIFFHPDTMGAKDDATYPAFTGDWPGVQRYTLIQGVQLAAVRKMVLLVPFMTRASRSNQPTTNMFAARGLDTLNGLIDGCQTAIGQTPKGTKLTRLGVASFSSGIEHLARFASKLGGAGIIKEQLDLDSAFITRLAHSNTPRLKGAKNIQVTQMSPSDPRLTGPRAAADVWLQLGFDAWPTTTFGPPTIKGIVKGDTIHNNIGNFMFRAMADRSIIK